MTYPLLLALSAALLLLPACTIISTPDGAFAGHLHGDSLTDLADAVLSDK